MNNARPVDLKLKDSGFTKPIAPITDLVEIMKQDEPDPPSIMSNRSNSVQTMKKQKLFFKKNQREQVPTKVLSVNRIPIMLVDSQYHSN